MFNLTFSYSSYIYLNFHNLPLLSITISIGTTMIASVFSTGEETLDRLIRAVPIVFPGSRMVLNALCMLVAMILSRPNWGKRIGLTDDLSSKFDEIYNHRQTTGNIQGIDITIVYEFFYDVLEAYRTRVGMIFRDSDWKRMTSDKRIQRVRGVENGKFFDLHAVLYSLTYGFVHDGQDYKPAIVPLDQNQLRSRAARPQYCYLSLIKPRFACLTASFLGAIPTLGALLSFLTPEVLVEDCVLDELVVFCRPEDGLLHITKDRDAYDRISLPVRSLLNCVDTEFYRRQDVFSVFDRVGAHERTASYDSLFKDAVDSLAELSISEESVNVSTVDSYYKDAAVNFQLPDSSDDFPDGHRSLRMRHDAGLLRSFVNVWPKAIREHALVLALRCYDDRMINLHVISEGLKTLKTENRFISCDQKWRVEVSELVSISKTDADYWLEVINILADNFRTLQDSDVPPWLLKDFRLKQSEFIESAIIASLPSPKSVKGVDYPSSRIEEILNDYGERKERSNATKLSEAIVEDKRKKPTSFKAFVSSPEGREIYDRWKKKGPSKIPGCKPIPFRITFFGSQDMYENHKHQCIMEVMRKDWHNGTSRA